MIRAANPPPPSKPPLISLDDDGDVSELRIALHKQNGLWDLAIVITTLRLRKIMQRGTILTFLVDEVPGFGAVPPVCLVFMSELTRSNETLEQLVSKTSSAMEKKGNYIGVLPVVFKLSDAAILRQQKICTLTSHVNHPNHLKKRQVPAWERLDKLVILFADTKTEVTQLLQRLVKHPNITMEGTDGEDKSMW